MYVINNRLFWELGKNRSCLKINSMPQYSKSEFFFEILKHFKLLVNDALMEPSSSDLP